MVGYASQTDKLIRLADAGDSNRAFGSISGIQTDCSEDLVLQNDCFVFGDEQIKTTGVNAVLADDANSTVHIAVFKEASTVKNPSKYASAFYNLQVVGAGDVVLSTRRYDKSGVQIGSAITQTSSVAAGFNQIPVSVPNSEDLAYITVFRAGGSASDTATGVTLISIDVREYTNKVKTI